MSSLDHTYLHSAINLVAFAADLNTSAKFNSQDHFPNNANVKPLSFTLETHYVLTNHL